MYSCLKVDLNKLIKDKIIGLNWEEVEGLSIVRNKEDKYDDY